MEHRRMTANRGKAAWRWGVAVLALGIAISIPGASVLGQGASAFGGAGGSGGLSMPRFAPEGVWGQVITVTPKWLVIQTDNGQQFPVSVEAIGLFVMRWPTSPALLSPDAWAEVTGVDVSSNQVLAGQVDIYEGAARNLVTPASQYLVGYNRVMSQLSTYQMNTFNFYQLLPGEEFLPRRRHVVGPVVSREPLAIAVGGNTAVRVVPTMAGLVMSQVTPGSASFVRPGDLAWFMPAGSNPKSLMLSQLIVYKPGPLAQFVP